MIARDLAERSMERTGRRRISGIAVLIVALAGICFLLGGAGVARPQSGQSRPEWTLFYSANRERAARGMAPLKWDQGLAAAAHRHALLMMNQGALSHQFAGEMDLTGRLRQLGARFVAAAENVAEGPGAEGIHMQWMQSPPHRRNLLDAEMNLIGVAVAQRNGELFAVEDFTHGIAEVSFEEQEKQVEKLLRSNGLRVVNGGGEAKSVCEGRRAKPGGLGRTFSTRYTTDDLKTLPAELLREMHAHHYRTTGVAACEPRSGGSFSEYQIGVLLHE